MGSLGSPDPQSSIQSSRQSSRQPSRQVSRGQSSRQSPKPRAQSTKPKFQEVFGWGQVDFAYPSDQARQAAIADGTFIPENNLPLGIEVSYH